MRIVLQIGYQKALGRRKYGQSVKAFVNDCECSWKQDGEGNGKYLTSKVDANKGIFWYLWEGDLGSNDVIKIEAKTYVTGAGPDETRTFEAIYYTDENSPIREVEVPGVGLRGYPLLKGRVLKMGSVSEQDKREQEIAEFLEDEGF